MAFIEKKDPTILNIMLTSCGRELLSTGNLTFNYYAIGDSEVDYRFNSGASIQGFTAFDSNILRPADKNPKQLSFIPRNFTGDSYNEISTIPSAPYEIVNPVSSIGFFTSGATEFITDGNHVKQPDAMVAMSGVSGGNQLQLLKAPTYGTSGLEPEVGDLLLIKWTVGESTTGYTLNKDYPTPYLTYQIVSVSGGSLGSGSITITVDRDIPNLSGLSLTGIYAGAMVYYNYINFTGDTIFSDFGTDYLDEAVLSFLQNSQCPTVVFPFWNLSIIFTDEIAGIQFVDRKYTQFNSRGYGGFVSYIQNQAPVLKKLGVIHYTNSSPANVYGEELYLDTPILEIPTIMWHKSSGQTLGTTLTPIGGVQTLTGLDTRYYDLADEQGFVVGKVFTDLKIFVIEDQELLFAMSYKSNRNWTVPDYNANTSGIAPPCPTPTGGTNVTWSVPINVAACTCIISYTGDCSGIEYRHSNLSWTELPDWDLGCSLSLGNICDAGYRVTICNYDTLPPSGCGIGGGISICARDYINDCNVCSSGCGGAPQTKHTVTLSAINNDTGFYFTGCIF